MQAMTEHLAPPTSPSYFGPRDYPWLLCLIEEYERFAGRRSAELAAHLAEPLRVACPRERLELARRVLDRICKPEARAAVSPAKAREALFGAASDRRPRDQALRAAAERLGTGADDVLSSLFADLPGERVLPGLPAGLDPSALAQRLNLALVASWLTRATRVRLTLSGNARDVVRYALLRGLLCVVRGDPQQPERLTLEISGPLTLFRRTLVYGRALASLVPRLAHCDRFELLADCVLGGETVAVRVRSGDPIFPSDPPKRFDSLVERRFAREFARAAPDWDVVREPAPIPAEGTLIFPDFALVHRRAEQPPVWLEIVGFWTPQYLTDKLRRLRVAGLPRLILCIDASLACAPGDLPESARVVRFVRRIDPLAVLAVLDKDQL